MIFKCVLTKSEEVCKLLTNSFEIEQAKAQEKYPDVEVSIGYGKLTVDSGIPPIYHNKGYYMNVIVVHTKEVEEYELYIS